MLQGSCHQDLPITIGFCIRESLKYINLCSRVIWCVGVHFNIITTTQLFAGDKKNHDFFVRRERVVL